jgi:glycosyltransferase involved in cell wall biosynthesis
MIQSPLPRADPRPSTPIEISVVIPTLNEEANAVGILAAVEDALGQVPVRDYEVIFIDNGSSDRTVPFVKDICSRKPQVRLIVNTRNFGQMRSPTHGIYQARGDAVIAMCADFQDPPSLIPEMVARWRDGAKIVLGVREVEKGSLTIRAARAVGYGFLSRFADYRVIPGATGFGLFDRKVVDTLARWNEPEPFFRGMLVESGFRLSTIRYERPPRQHGASKNNFTTLFSFALSGLAGSSKNLLRLPLVIGIALIAASVLLLPVGVLTALSGGPWLGVSLAAALAVLLGFLFVSVGLLGEQVRLISERTRHVPLVIEEERVNF